MHDFSVIFSIQFAASNIASYTIRVETDTFTHPGLNPESAGAKELGCLSAELTLKPSVAPLVRP